MDSIPNPFQNEITFIRDYTTVGNGDLKKQNFEESSVPAENHPVQEAGSNYDGGRMRSQPGLRRAVDYSSSMALNIHTRIFQADNLNRRTIQPDPLHNPFMLPPAAFRDKPATSICTRPVRTATNKVKCPVFVVKWMPCGKRLITGSSSGEFTLWSGTTFSFETILQAHDSAVRSMVWSHDEQWMITSDHMGFVKYWQANMNSVRMYQIHKEVARGLSFCPTDQKFASCSDDNSVRVWDFLTGNEEMVMLGHGSQVRCVDWHPQMSLVISGSRDSQQPVKLWDVRSGNCVSTLHNHKQPVTDVKWNKNGNWFVTASRDKLIKLMDIRNDKTELKIFRGHKDEATAIAWHPIHENMLVSGDSSGSMIYWIAGCSSEVARVEDAHSGVVWKLDWHPVGHVLASGSNDHTTKFWKRNNPGDGYVDDAPDNDTETDIFGNACVSKTYFDPKVSVIPGLDIPVDELAGLDAIFPPSATNWVDGQFVTAQMVPENSRESRQIVLEDRQRIELKSDFNFINSGLEDENFHEGQDGNWNCGGNPQIPGFDEWINEDDAPNQNQKRWGGRRDDAPFPNHENWSRGRNHRKWGYDNGRQGGAERNYHSNSSTRNNWNHNNMPSNNVNSGYVHQNQNPNYNQDFVEDDGFNCRPNKRPGMEFGRDFSKRRNDFPHKGERYTSHKRTRPYQR